MWRFCARRLEILSILRREDGLRCLLSKLWETGSSGSKILPGMRLSHRPMIFFRRAGCYTVESRLGGGRYGVCYLARDPEGRRVVLKKFRPKIWRENSGGNHHEAVILSGLDHPAIPEFLGVLNLPRGYFFILEYKQGTTLKDLLFHRHTEFTESMILRVGTQLLDILSYIHSRSVVHGDISISNIVDDGRQTALLDFGLARYTGGDLSVDLDHSCFGNVLLYLLYSRYRGKKFGAWYEELDLSAGKTLFLKRLMGLEAPFCDDAEVKEAFLTFFSD